MIPISVNHGLHPIFLRMLWNHIMHWDPTAHAAVDHIRCTVFQLSSDQMLIHNLHFIAACTPCYVMNTFGNSLDVKTSQPLFFETGMG